MRHPHHHRKELDGVRRAGARALHVAALPFPTQQGTQAALRCMLETLAQAGRGGHLLMLSPYAPGSQRDAVTASSGSRSIARGARCAIARCARGRARTSSLADAALSAFGARALVQARCDRRWSSRTTSRPRRRALPRALRAAVRVLRAHRSRGRAADVCAGRARTGAALAPAGDARRACSCGTRTRSPRSRRCSPSAWRALAASEPDKVQRRRAAMAAAGADRRGRARGEPCRARAPPRDARAALRRQPRSLSGLGGRARRAARDPARASPALMLAGRHRRATRAAARRGAARRRRRELTLAPLDRRGHAARAARRGRPARSCRGARRAGLPIKLLDAMARGVPCVASRRRGRGLADLRTPSSSRAATTRARSRRPRCAADRDAAQRAAIGDARAAPTSPPQHGVQSRSCARSIACAATRCAHARVRAPKTRHDRASFLSASRFGNAQLSARGRLFLGPTSPY